MYILDRFIKKLKNNKRTLSLEINASYKKFNSNRIILINFLVMTRKNLLLVLELFYRRVLINLRVFNFQNLV